VIFSGAGAVTWQRSGQARTKRGHETSNVGAAPCAGVVGAKSCGTNEAATKGSFEKAVCAEKAMVFQPLGAQP